MATSVLARATGLEPATTGSTVRRLDTATTNAPSQLEPTPTPEVPTVVPSVPTGTSSPSLPPEIAKIAAAWNHLPEAVRAGITAMIDAANAGRKNRFARDEAGTEGD